MASRLDNSVGSRLVDSLLRIAGETYIYRRGDQEEEITAARSMVRSEVLDSQGAVVVTELADFKVRTADLPFGLPQPGDRFSLDDLTWRVEPIPGEKCFSVQSPQMTRIHSVRQS